MPQARIVFTSMLLGGWRPATPWMPFTAIVTLADEGQGTRYVATVMHADQASRDRHEQMGFFDGWNTCIDQLEAFARRAAGELSAPAVRTTIGRRRSSVRRRGRAAPDHDAAAGVHRRAHEDAMREPFELVHHNRYRVSCRPEPTPDGTFLARVVVSWIDDDGAALDHRLRPELPPFPTAGEAADVGRDVALRWLDALEAESVKALAAESDAPGPGGLFRRPGRMASRGRRRSRSR